MFYFSLKLHAQYNQTKNVRWTHFTFITNDVPEYTKLNFESLFHVIFFWSVGESEFVSRICDIAVDWEVIVSLDLWLKVSLFTKFRTFVRIFKSENLLYILFMFTVYFSPYVYVLFEWEWNSTLSDKSWFLFIFY